MKVSGILTLVLLSFLLSCASTPADKTADNSVEKAQQPAEKIKIWKIQAETAMTPDGTIDKVVNYEYDGESRLLHVVEKNHLGSIIRESAYEWNGGKLIRMRLSDQNGPASQVTYVSDDEGKVIEESKVDGSDNLLSRTQYQYDGDKISMTAVYDGTGVHLLTSRYHYAGDELITVEYQLSDDTVEARFERTLENGRVVSEQTVLPDGTVETAKKFEYDGDNVISETYYAESQKSKSVHYEYDSSGNVVRESWRNRLGKEYEVIEKKWILFEIDA